MRRQAERGDSGRSWKLGDSGGLGLWESFGVWMGCCCPGGADRWPFREAGVSEERSRLTQSVRLARGCLPLYTLFDCSLFLNPLTDSSPSLAHAIDFPALGPIQWRLVIASGRGHLLFVFFWCLALCAPGVYLGDLVLERCVHQPVALQRVLACKLGRYYESCESLPAASCMGGLRCVSSAPQSSETNASEATG